MLCNTFMNNQRFVFIVCFLCGYNISFGQRLTNEYGNVGWIADSISEIELPERAGFNGFSLAGSGVSRFQHNLIALLNNQDSNSYSRVRYNLGSNANQSLRTHLIRPISEKHGFFIGVDRDSYPGWMNRSFSRRTNLGMGYYGQLKEYIGIEVNIERRVQDFEINGGVRGNDYRFNDTDGFIDVNSDVYLDNAFQRMDEFNAGIGVNYSIYQTDSNALVFGIRSDFLQQKFKFSDLSPNNSYYSRLGKVDSTLPFNDSAATQKLMPEFHLAWNSTIDSVRSVFLGAKFGSDLINYSAVSQRVNTQNIFGEASGKYSHYRFSTSVKALYFLSGYNKNDHAVDFEGQWKSKSHHVGLDSNSGFVANLAILYRVNEPNVVFERYESSYLLLDHNLDKINALKYNLSIGYGIKGFSAKAMIGVTNLRNWVYTDSVLNVYQFEGLIRLVKPSLSVAYINGFLKSKVEGSYLLNNKPLIYSLPSWMLRGEISTFFPVFKKKIYLELGMDGWFFSDYYARGYHPLIDQFYVQTVQEYGNYLQLNPFLKANIQSVDVKLSIINANYGMIADDPLIAPGYPSIPRYFQLSIDWRFKN